ncbi:ATP-binding cassette domain-containing protein [Staphylococcus simulans]|uniref:ATP-binding cassette domain-containing protein n=1 Tax=Staphylococcus simulans TaxID=1286 RepID=UPI0021D0ABA5|nr:ABC transporter ATP-binding protein [Staphylococcus simulans]UXV38790.1 ABC transporter ATP-binding protein [Staphylococcus simulans]UXV41212.1 ABC transporter ATP-binding protein [Staphylococcus simulans]
MLRLKCLNKSFDKKHMVINNLSISIDDGIHCIIGKNGAGKTTLLNLISSLIFPDSGDIAIDEKSIYKHKNLRSNIFYVPIEPFFYERLSAKENLLLICSLFEKHIDISDIKNIFKMVNLEINVLNNPVYTFSSGMKQKLNFASMLLVKPYIILLDEPFNALDYETQEKFSLLLKEMQNQKHIIIFTSHISSTISTLAENIMVLKNGYIIHQEETAQISNMNEWIKKMIGGE